MGLETLASVAAKVAERLILGPAASQRTEAQARPASQAAQCERCPQSGYPTAAINLARAS